MMKAKVAILRTSPESIIEDYQRLMHLADYERYISKDEDTLIKLNLSWTKYFPSCSSQPWQLDGVVRALLQDGYDRQKLIPVENKTVVTNPTKGAKNNKWAPIMTDLGLEYVPLPDVEWVKYEFKENLLKLNQIFPKGIEIPKMFIGKNIIHLPTVKTHGHSVTTGAVKNAFGGLLKEVRHFAHKYIHEVLVDLLIMQRELHPGIFSVMDGTVCGDGAGPRTMVPKVQNVILASGDSVAVDAISAKIMGFDPMEIPYIRMAQERGLGVGDLEGIEVIGEDISGMNFHFETKKSFVIWGDQMIRKGFLSFFEKILFSPVLIFWAPLASNIYHDWIWYPTVGRKRIKQFMETEWGQLWEKY
jgi:uncharacterized protein (DUF362 family)